MDLLKAAFPGGSITGAPKYRAMEIIDELEHGKRNLYTGSIGYLTLDGSCDFNIVIGLCVGHDTLFLRHSKVPTTVMIVKDRVLQHNPVAALYGVQSMYSRFKDLGL